MRICPMSLLVSLLALCACTDASIMSPHPNTELTDPGLRLDAAIVNSHLYGSFLIRLPAGVITVITSGPANFPGHPPTGPGTCDNGTWINAQGKRIAGSLSKPHPNCIRSSSAVAIVLEPISACYTGFGPWGECGVALPAPAGGDAVGLIISEGPLDDINVYSLKYGSFPVTYSTTGYGILLGYAIDAATLGTTNRRIGTLTIDMAQFDSPSTGYLDIDGSLACEMDATIVAPCLNLVISAEYAPLPTPDGIGTPQTVAGFLWIAPASAPYNYSP